MGRSISLKERNYSEQIYQLRQKGETRNAILLCQEAIRAFKSSNFFYKICGDMYFELGQYLDAINMYMKFMDNIGDTPEYFTNFAKFVKKVSEVYEIPENIFDKIARRVGNKKYDYIIRKGLVNVLLDTYPVPDEVEKAVFRVLSNQVTMDVIKYDYNNICLWGRSKEIVYLCKVAGKECQKGNDSINRFLLKRLEMNGLYEYALQLVNNILDYSMDVVMVRTLLRICRYCDDYSAAEIYLEEKNIENEEDFNIQYELVFYYDMIGDDWKRNNALQCIEKLSGNRLPICLTLFKLYVKYNMLEDAQKIQKKIESFQSTKEMRSARKETEDVVWEKLRTLVSEQEHNRQLSAMSELLRGFSHELGQQITNIRYAIQLYYRKKRKLGAEIDAEQQKLLDSVLQQTKRVGNLLGRFSPIVSSRSEKKDFSVIGAIRSVFGEFEVRLHNESIEYSIEGDDSIELFGEEVQFEQVFYNLIINSIYAIRHSGKKGILQVLVKRNSDIVRIEFSDNGTGIAIENQRKIFNPFFSTKDKEIEEGGEGLGLFIVWNILKIFSGRICVDSRYNEGAKFVIEINTGGN